MQQERRYIKDKNSPKGAERAGCSPPPRPYKPFEDMLALDDDHIHPYIQPGMNPINTAQNSRPMLNLHFETESNHPDSNRA